MEHKLLTDAKIRGLEPAAPGARYSIADSISPLEVRITDKGSKSFVLRMRAPGQPSRRVLVGALDQITLAKARALARDMASEIRAGRDPKRKTADTTFGAIAEQYIADYLPSKRTAQASARQIRNELIKRWGKVQIERISPRDIVDMLQEVKARAPAGAYGRNLWIHCRTIFSWAITHGYLEHAPTDRIRPGMVLGQKRSRERVLSDDEIRRIWNAATDYPMGLLVRMLLMTGVRQSEARCARWNEFSSDRWIIPSERFKTGSVHIIPMTPALKNFLDTLPRVGAGDYLFSHGKIPFNNVDQGKARLDRASRVTSWVLHDLRRTVRTRLSALGVRQHIAELVLGHARRGMAGVYDRHEFEDEMRAALEAWQARLAEIVS
jgi:integrase